jgi:hypothetical protein
VNVRSIARGRLVAEIVWNWAKTDAIGHEHYLHNTEGWDWQAHFKKDGDWKPTPPDYSLPVGGVWGQARTFSLKSDAERLCPPPLPFLGSNEFRTVCRGIGDIFAEHTDNILSKRNG